MSASADMPWHAVSARRQADALARGEVSAQGLLAQALERIERFDGALNAVVVRDPSAQEAARRADAALARGERAPLLGVPVTVKESFDVAGLATTAGQHEHAGILARTDAPAVAALRRAGAVVLGKTNVPVANGDIQTWNPLYGLTRNPWDPARTPGGSSGGSAAAVAAGYVALELGSDIGGSVRIPAHFCGICAHKPSQGIVSLLGSGAPAGRFVEPDLACAGPLAREIGDLELALDVLVNSDPDESRAWRLQLPPPRQRALADFRVLLLDTHPLLGPGAPARSALDATEALLRQAGVAVQRGSDLLPDLDASHKVYQQLLVGSALARRPPAFFEQARAAIAGLDADDDGFQAVRIRAAFLGHREWLQAHEARLALRRQWRRVFETFDVVLTPVTITPAFPHDRSQPRDARHVQVDGAAVPYLDLFVWVGVPTVAGLPATTVPVTRDRGGLPLGIQVIGPYLEDRTALAFAGGLEALRGPFPAPPLQCGDRRTGETRCE